MYKSDLAKIIAEKTGLTFTQAEEALNTTLETVINTVASGEKVVLTGFGSLESVPRKARVGRHPKTGDEIQIPARNGVKFSVGKGFKETVANA